MLDKFSDVQKGAIFIVIGTVFFLYSLGIFQSTLNVIIIIGSLALVLYGFLLGDFLPKIKRLFHKK